MSEPLSEIYVCKFGGSSLATREMVDAVKHIISDDERRQYIVLSAPGGNPKVTDILEMAADLFLQEKEAEARQIIEEIGMRFGLIYPAAGEAIVEDLVKRSQKALEDGWYRANLMAAGEYWNARLFAQEIDAEFLDAADYIKLDGSDPLNARVLPETHRLLRETFHRKNSSKKTAPGAGKKVIGGFYGSTPEGGIALLRRGGSDRTGSILAAAVGAAVYENFSDSPVYAASPEYVENPAVIREMTYNELRDLSYSGFRIFQQEALTPLERTATALHIRSTAGYPDQGTWVVEDRVSDPLNPVAGIAYKDGFCAFSVEASGVNESVGLLRDVLSVFAERGIPVEFPSAGIDDISVIVQQDAVSRSVSALKREMAQVVYNHQTEGGEFDLNGMAAEFPEVRFQEHLGCLVAAGKGIKCHKGVEARAITALEEAGVDPVASSKGAAERCLLYAIPSRDKEKAIGALYKEFVG